MADLIKKIKIKKQDGTFTDYIPIGAEAKNISTNDGDSVELKLNKKPYYYNTVADMKADLKLKAGDMAVTLGYYLINDNGGATYKIRLKTNDDVEDGGNIHFIGETLVAEIIIENGVLNVRQFGCKGDGIFGVDSTQLQLAINSYDTIFIPKGVYIVEQLNVTKSNQKIYGEGRLSHLYGVHRGDDDEIVNILCIKPTASTVEISDLYIEGANNVYGTQKVLNGLYFEERQTWGGGHIIDNVRCYHLNGYGFYLGEKNQGCKITRVSSTYNKNDSAYINGADNIISDCYFTDSRKFGLRFNCSDSVISGLRCNENNLNDEADCGGMIITKGNNIMNGIMCQQNKVTDIIINGHGNVIDYISNMLHSENNISSSCTINNDYNDIKANIYNGKSGFYCDYALKFTDSVVGNNVSINKYTTNYATKGFMLTNNKHFHPSNIIMYNGKNYNQYINVFDFIKTWNSVNPGAVDVTKNDYDEYTANTGLTSLSNGQNITIAMKNTDSKMDTMTRIYVSIDYESNLPVSSAYEYRVFLWDNTRNVKLNPIVVQNTRTQGHIDAVFDVDLSSFNPNNVRLGVYKISDDEFTTDSIKVTISNIIICGQ